MRPLAMAAMAAAPAAAPLSLALAVAAGAAAAANPPGVIDDIAPGSRGKVSLQVFFLTTCPRCSYFIHESFLPLAQADLPEEQVELSVLPVLKGMRSPVTCMATSECRLALTPLCALRQTFGSDVSAMERLRITRFVSCDVNQTASTLGRTEERTKDCALQAGLQWGGPGGLQKCAIGPEAFTVMYSNAYVSKVLAAMHMLKGKGFKEPPEMPWIFFDGVLLFCQVAYCYGEMMPLGYKAWKAPVALMALVCDRLDPEPPACTKFRIREAKEPTPTVALLTTPLPCINCNEVGSYRWRRGREPLLVGALAFSVIPCLFAVGFAFGAAQGALHHAFRRSVTRLPSRDDEGTPCCT